MPDPILDSIKKMYASLVESVGHKLAAYQILALFSQCPEKFRSMAARTVLLQGD